MLLAEPLAISRKCASNLRRNYFIIFPHSIITATPIIIPNVYIIVSCICFRNLPSAFCPTSHLRDSPPGNGIREGRPIATVTGENVEAKQPADHLSLGTVNPEVRNILQITFGNKDIIVNPLQWRAPERSHLKLVFKLERSAAETL
uniref:Uncharacterized protein n=1 Tax=Glossina palpalis gambiensis TaxID=67801 RepID=A0A1B0B595_9MUSC